MRPSDFVQIASFLSMLIGYGLPFAVVLVNCQLWVGRMKANLGLL